jgi:polysaccharide biosynthesis PFTS motif protein
LVRITGFPDFSDFAGENLEQLSQQKFTISVFDYLPGVNHYGTSTLSDLGYYSWEANLKFLTQIYEICEKNRFLLLHKSKRPISPKNIPLSYKKSINIFDPLYYRNIDTRVAVKRILLASKVSISKPITSPAIVAKEIGLHSIYFDPLGRVQKSDPALRGIPIFSEKNEMEKYLQSIMDQQNT